MKKLLIKQLYFDILFSMFASFGIIGGIYFFNKSYLVDWNNIAGILFCYSMLLILFFKFRKLVFHKYGKLITKNYIISSLLVLLCLIAIFVSNHQSYAVSNNTISISPETSTSEYVTFGGLRPATGSRLKSHFNILTSYKYILSAGEWTPSPHWCFKSKSKCSPLVFTVSSNEVISRDLVLFITTQNATPETTISITINDEEVIFPLISGEQYLDIKPYLAIVNQISSNNLRYYIPIISFHIVWIWLLMGFIHYIYAERDDGEKVMLIISSVIIMGMFIYSVSTYYIAAISTDAYFSVPASEFNRTIRIDWFPPFFITLWTVISFLIPITSITISLCLYIVITFWLGIFIINYRLSKINFWIIPPFLLLIWSLYCSIFDYKAIVSDYVLLASVSLFIGLICIIPEAKCKCQKATYIIIASAILITMLLIKNQSITLGVGAGVLLFNTLIPSFKNFATRIFIIIMLSFSFVAGSYFVSKKVLNPYVYKVLERNPNKPMLLKESLAICYFSGDWTLPEWFTEKELEIIEKTFKPKYISRVNSLLDFVHATPVEQFEELWIEKVKAYPHLYLKQKIESYKTLKKASLFSKNYFSTYTFDIILLICLVLGGIKIFRSNDQIYWLLFGVGAMGTGYNTSYLIVSAANNYRYIYTTEYCGVIAMILLIYVLCRTKKEEIANNTDNEE